MDTVHPNTRRVRAAFTLIEALVVVAVVGLLVAMLLPALASTRASARSASCLNNLRQSIIICRAFADNNDGYSPAIGQPYHSLPNWALVIQSEAGRLGASAGDLYTPATCLVCPQAAAVAGREMTRTYAMNATGHAGGTGCTGCPTDPDNFDVLPLPGGRPASIRMDRIMRPALVPLLVDSSLPAPAPDQPPPTRTSSVIDFRNAAHNPARLAFIHRGATAFNAGMADGSASSNVEVSPAWLDPLP